MIKKFIPHTILKIMLNTVILCNTDMLESKIEIFIQDFIEVNDRK